MRAICPWLRAWNHTTLKIAYRRKLQRRMAALGILPCGSHLRPPRPLRSRYSGSRACRQAPFLATLDATDAVLSAQDSDD